MSCRTDFSIMLGRSASLCRLLCRANVDLTNHRLANAVAGIRKALRRDVPASMLHLSR